MDSGGFYQNMQDSYHHPQQQQQQQQEYDQTELFEYNNDQTPEVLRHASNLLESLKSNINRTLLFAKLFYFWYFAAFGSLFPLMSIYFKQMGMGPSYCGILMGFRPFVEFFSAPFWSVVSTRFRQAKNILLMAILSWIIFTVAIGLIKPPPHSCWREMNATHQIIERVGFSSSTILPTIKLIVKRQTIKQSIFSLNKTKDRISDQNLLISSTIATSSRRRKITIKTTTLLSKLNDDEDDDFYDINEGNLANEKDRLTTQNNYEQQQSNLINILPIDQPKKPMGNPLTIKHIDLSFVKPLASPILYEKKDVHNVFMVFLLLIIVGEFFSAPAITLADACTLSYLGQDTELYGRQRMFGSLGWGLAIFIVATILDQSKSLTLHACGTSGPLEKNYTVCFAAFSVCMTFALITATRFQFSYDKNEQLPLRTLNDDLKRKVFSTTVKANVNTNEYNTQEVDVNSIKQNAFSTSNTIKLMQLIQIFMTFKNGTFLFIAWWMGCGVGLVFTFLFWHLQDLGGSPTLFGVASIINHTSELFAYFFLHELIHRLGHIKILFLGLLGNFIRFFYISIISNPWLVLPFEFIQGLTHAAVWATACSYLSQTTPENLRISCQGLLQGFHFGFGRGCGALFGGFLASYFGTDITFRVYAIISLILMGVFIYLNRKYQQRQQPITSVERASFSVDDPHQFLGNSSLLAPHGAPTNPKWQTKFSSGLRAGIKQDQLYSSPSVIVKQFNNPTTEDDYHNYHHGY
ncbi:unnamed protein product [Rotaria socialis]|uniref:Major facilitator superfamily associated domain-containing protein n=1 Tax=Rotaria socialis TaxID=392032 RepID=A0A818NSA3_9BILA|nr:unnamed protein product [Rotaria socialis]CAF3361873.1 unnamed protein product [Rotaria socialis]CAF3610425.1 unnamed protein product [Rotaria socialis]CAF4135037.1 unnamed protein product [Rotaria socialis]CAF4469459.1 unnamed protein product [Rotaria socialis]